MCMAAYLLDAYHAMQHQHPILQYNLVHYCARTSSPTKRLLRRDRRAMLQSLSGLRSCAAFSLLALLRTATGESPSADVATCEQITITLACSLATLRHAARKQ